MYNRYRYKTCIRFYHHPTKGLVALEDGREKILTPTETSNWVDEKGVYLNIKMDYRKHSVTIKNRKTVLAPKKELAVDVFTEHFPLERDD